MKASKRLVKALIALVASIVLCIGVCLAWFANNGKVDANDLSENIKNINITKFEVEAFRLTDRQTQTVDGKTETTYKVSSSAGNSEVTMSSYGGLVGNSDTALLLKFTFTFAEKLDKNYAIYADCKETRKAIGSKQGAEGLLLECALSSVVSFYGIGETTLSASSTVTQKAEMTGEEVLGTDGNLIALNDGISDSELSGTFYCIVDYVENKVFTQYYKALTIKGTTLSTPMDFLADIDFYMGESKSS